MTLLGVYVGNDAEAAEDFEAWLGSDVDLIHAVVGSASWSDFTSSASWMINTLWSDTDASLLWSVPLIVSDSSASLAEAATGAYDDYYRSVAETLAANTEGDGPIYIRTGWEFNGDWFAWSAEGNEADYIAAYREFVDTFREVSDRFVFEWTVDAAYGGMDPSTAYPGDDYVDIIGMDFYWKSEYIGSDGTTAFETIRDWQYGLQWLEDFAAAHGKSTAYSEWGISSDDAADYLALVKEWFDSHDVAYQSYWDSDAAYEGKLSDGSFPDSGATYQALFAGSGGTDESAATTDTTTAETSVTDAAAGDTDATTADTGDTASTTDPTTLAASAEPSHWFYGSAGQESWTGTSGDDGYKSAGGGDTMAGGAGDDTYVVYSAADTVVEQAGEGTDTVSTWLSSFTLPDNVENLVITGTSWTEAIGNALDNRITGNDSPNTLNGAGGADLLTGGGGDDVFVIASGEGGDTITDFSTGDVLHLEGFGDGASLTHDGDLWTVTTAAGEATSFTLEDVTALAAGDYILS